MFLSETLHCSRLNYSLDVADRLADEHVLIGLYVNLLQNNPKWLVGLPCFYNRLSAPVWLHSPLVWVMSIQKPYSCTCFLWSHDMKNVQLDTLLFTVWSVYVCKPFLHSSVTTVASFHVLILPAFEVWQK